MEEKERVLFWVKLGGIFLLAPFLLSALVLLGFFVGSFFQQQDLSSIYLTLVLANAGMVLGVWGLFMIIQYLFSSQLIPKK